MVFGNDRVFPRRQNNAPSHAHAPPPPVTKDASESTIDLMDTNGNGVPSANIAANPAKDAIHGSASQHQNASPVKWGYLAAAVLHLVWSGILAFIDHAPMAIVHGVLNLVVGLSLGFIFILWGKFNSVLYVRRGLTRFSAAMIATMLGVMIGHASLMSIYSHADPALDGGCRSSSVGCLNQPWRWTPLLYAIAILLWTGFSYIQSIAVSNLRHLYERTGGPAFPGAPPPHEETTLREEMANSVGNPHRPGSLPQPLKETPKSKLIFFSVMLGLAAVMYVGAVEAMPNYPVIGAADLLSAVAMQSVIVSQGARGTYWGAIAQAVFLLWAIIAFGVTVGDADYPMPLRGRIVGGVVSIVFMVSALVYTFLYYKNHHEEDLADRSRAVRHFIGRSHEATPEDPMEYYVAGIAQAEGTNGHVIV